MTQANNVAPIDSNKPAPIDSNKPAPVYCPHCMRKIFDGEVIRARAVNVVDKTALCRCKEWVAVPITLTF